MKAAKNYFLRQERDICLFGGFAQLLKGKESNLNRKNARYNRKQSNRFIVILSNLLLMETLSIPRIQRSVGTEGRELRHECFVGR